MTQPVVEEWDTLRIVHLLATILMPAAMAWFMLVAKDRRRALEDKLGAMEESFRIKLLNIEQQLKDLRVELRDGRSEAREGRKECAEDVRAISAQISEYPRRREVQEAVSEIWREIRSRGGGR
jgi:hypothetical protein